MDRIRVTDVFEEYSAFSAEEMLEALGEDEDVEDLDLGIGRQIPHLYEESLGS